MQLGVCAPEGGCQALYAAVQQRVDSGATDAEEGEAAGDEADVEVAVALGSGGAG